MSWCLLAKRRQECVRHSRAKWGSLSSCGRLAIGLRRLPTVEQDSILPHAKWRTHSCEHTSTAGVTLIELLVAMALLSLLSVGILFAMRIGLTSMERSKNRFMTNRRVLGVERILTEQIAGFVPTKADCRTSPEVPPQKLPFFQGEPGTMRFVSTYSLQQAWRGQPLILEFQVIPGEEGRGVRLVVNELPYSGPLSTGILCTGQVMDQMTARPAVIFRPVAIGPISFVLADKLASCRFGFREDREAPAPPIWHPKWTGFKTPSAIRIDLMPLEPDPSRLHVPSVVAPVRPNRDPMLTYTEVM